MMNYIQDVQKKSCTALGATSFRNIEHFGQMVHDYGQLRLRDLGTDENLKIYGRLAPPVVDFSKIDHKMRISYGRRDNIAVSTDVLNFCADMKDFGKDIKCTPIGTEPEYDHINFLYSDKIEELQFELLKTLENI